MVVGLLVTPQIEGVLRSVAHDKAEQPHIEIKGAVEVGYHQLGVSRTHDVEFRPFPSRVDQRRMRPTRIFLLAGAQAWNAVLADSHMDGLQLAVELEAELTPLAPDPTRLHTSEWSSEVTHVLGVHPRQAGVD